MDDQDEGEDVLNLKDLCEAVSTLPCRICVISFPIEKLADKADEVKIKAQ